jgi:hypothetical protein
MQNDYPSLRSLIELSTSSWEPPSDLANIDHDFWNIAKVSPNCQIRYIKIYKNASTYFNKYLSEWDDVNCYGISSLRSMDNLVVLRDPLERWASGMVTYIRYNKLLDTDFTEDFTILNKSTVFSKLFEEYLISLTGKDLHTYTQLWPLSFIDLNETYFFKLNDKLGYQINKFLKIYNIDNRCNNLKINQANTRDMLYLCLKEMLFNYKHNTFKQKLEDIYKHDYEFIQNITFYAR